MRITNFLSNSSNSCDKRAVAPDSWDQCAELRADDSLDGDGLDPVYLLPQIPVGGTAPYGGQIVNEGCCEIRLTVGYLDDGGTCDPCVVDAQTVEYRTITLQGDRVLDLPPGYISSILLETIDANGDAKAVSQDQKVSFTACNPPEVDVETLGEQAFVTVDKVPDIDPAVMGQTVTYTVTVTNIGAVDATVATLSDPLPANVTYVPGSVTGTGADDSGAPTLTWNFGTLAAGAVEVVTYQVTADVAGVSSNTATFSSPDC